MPMPAEPPSPPPPPMDWALMPSETPESVSMLPPLPTTTLPPSPALPPLDPKPTMVKPVLLPPPPKPPMLVAKMPSEKPPTVWMVEPAEVVTVTVPPWALLPPLLAVQTIDASQAPALPPSPPMLTA